MKQSAKIVFSLCLLCICASAMGASDVNVTGNLTMELRSGQMPVAGDEAGQPDAQLAIIPALDVNRITPRANSTVRYQLRLFSSLQQINQEPFLLYHQLMLNHQYAVSRRAQWMAMASLDYGQMDYSQSLFLANAESDDGAATDLGTDSQAEVPVIRNLSFSANTGFVYQTTPTSELGVQAQYGTATQLMDTPPAEQEDGESDFSSQTVGVQGDFSSSLTATDQLRFSVNAAAATFANHLWSFPVGLSLSWQRQWRANASFSLISGLTLITEEEEVDTAQAGTGNTAADDETIYTLSILPTGGFNVTVQPRWNTLTRWTLSGTAIVDTYVDTIEEAVLPLLATRFAATSDISPRIQFEASVGASTRILSDSQRDEDVTGDYPATLSASTGFQFFFTPNIQLLTGMEGNARASYPFDSPLEWGPWELVGVVTLNLRLPLTD